MKRLWITAVLLGCAASKPAESPDQVRTRLDGSVTSYTRSSQEDDPSVAAERAIDLVQLGAAARSLEAVTVGLAELFDPAGSPMARIAHRHGLFYTTKHPSLTAQFHADPSVRRLEEAAEGTESVTLRGLIHARLAEAARYAGLQEEAARQFDASGCVTAAWVSGPTAWDLSALHAPDPVAETLPTRTLGSLGLMFESTVSDGYGCTLHLNAASAQNGIRTVAVDFESTDDPIAVSMGARSAAHLTIDGVTILARDTSHPDTTQTHYARVTLAPGKHRLAVRAASYDSDTLELHVYGAKTRPASGSVQNTANRVSKVEPLGAVNARSPLSLAFQLATGNLQVFEGLHADPRPEVQLLVARALEAMRDLPHVEQMEASRYAYEQVQRAWPKAWEPALMLAVLDGRRASPQEASFVTLKALGNASHPFLQAYASHLAHRENLEDMRAMASKRSETLGGTAFHEELAEAQERGSATELAARSCGKVGRDWASETCHSVLLRMGKQREARAELERLAQLEGAPRRHALGMLRSALIDREPKDIRAAYTLILPGERTLAAAAMTGVPIDREKLLPTLEQALGDYGIYLAAKGQSASETMRSEALALVAKDRAAPEMKDSGTVVLRHVQDYDLGSDGILHYTQYDLRRVSGTQDVENNAQAQGPTVLGNDAQRTLRVRVLKRDGRIVEPDATPNASQDHAQLSQLEAGDYVEMLYEGWAMPDAIGGLSVFGPDLMPERTAVASAKLRLRVPERAALTFHVHPILGKGATTTSGGLRTTEYVLDHRPVRLMEPGTPRLEDLVGLVMTNQTWEGIARQHRSAALLRTGGIADTRRWAREAIGGERDPRKMAEALVRASGQAVKTATRGTFIAESNGVRDGAPGRTLRSVLATKEGSRTWLLHEGLRTVGIPVEVWLSETESWSDIAGFPPTLGRFTVPLLMVHLPGSDVLIDADVAGPPLPLGRISPELRGRKALKVSDGSIVTLPKDAEDVSDEADLRLALDASGDAKGDVTLLLRGQVAQSLSEALIKTVGIERDRLLRTVLSAWVPYATIDDITLSFSEDSWQIALRARLTLGGFGMREGPVVRIAGIEPMHIMFPRPAASTLTSMFGSQGSRQTNLSINRPTVMHLRRRIEVPKGTAAVMVPRAFRVQSDILRNASRTTSFAASPDGKTVLEDDFKLDLIAGVVPKEGFETFIGQLRSIDEAFLTDSVLRLPEASKR